MGKADNVVWGAVPLPSDHLWYLFDAGSVNPKPLKPDAYVCLQQTIVCPSAQSLGIYIIDSIIVRHLVQPVHIFKCEKVNSRPSLQFKSGPVNRCQLELELQVLNDLQRVVVLFPTRI